MFWFKLKAWFTPARRQAIQVFAGAVAPFAILFGFGSDGTWEQVLIIFGAALQFLSAILSLVNVKGANVWAVLRGALYSLAATVSPALVVLGLVSVETNATILTATSLGLAALSNLVAVFTSSTQQVAAVKVDDDWSSHPVG